MQPHFVWATWSRARRRAFRSALTTVLVLSFVLPGPGSVPAVDAQTCPPASPISPLRQYAIDDAIAYESDQLIFHVSLSDSLPCPWTFSFTAPFTGGAPNTATAGEDYTPITTTFTIPAGET